MNNTWKGPIVADPESKTFHMFLPLYKRGSLAGVTTVMHGIANNIAGPYDWDTLPHLPIESINPAFVTFVNSSGITVYSLWIGWRVLTADSLLGPFLPVPDFSYPGGNPAPIYFKGVFFMTNQATTQIFTTPGLNPGGVWTVFANISHDALPTNEYHVEDPFLWIDSRKNWHHVNHAYSNLQYTNCSESDVSAHFFSTDGKTWFYSRQPWGHTVTYDDGTQHSYTTLERPNLSFDPHSGVLTHINLAADLVTGNEGCGNRTDHAHFGHCPCDNCKWDDLSGTTVIALG
jgi:hypothetical protein